MGRYLTIQSAHDMPVIPLGPVATHEMFAQGNALVNKGRAGRAAADLPIAGRRGQQEWTFDRQGTKHHAIFS